MDKDSGLRGWKAHCVDLQNKVDRLELENSRLKASIDADNAQEPISNVDVYYDSNDSGDRILTWETFGSNFKSLGLGKHKLYARPIPAQQSIEQAHMAGQADAQEPVYQWRIDGDEGWIDCNKQWFDEIYYSHENRILYACPIPAQQSQAVAVPDDWDSQAYQSMCDNLEHWKSRAVEAENLVEKIRNEMSPMHMGEPVITSAETVDQALIAAGYARDAIRYKSELDELRSAPRITEQEPVLDKPARVNATNFMAGVPARMVVEAAQRYYEYRQENPPEKDSELQKKFFAAIDSIKKPAISQEQLLEIAISAISSVQSFSGLASSHAQRWFDDAGRAILNKLNEGKNG